MAEPGQLDGNVEDLELKGIIGFDGSIISGFRVHPDGEYVIYPLGNKVSIQHWVTKQQEFLSGHTNIISAIDVSRSGKYIASGQINHLGFKSWVILWDFATRTALSKHEIHKVRVEAVAFSWDDQYLISLGGRDCGSVVVWDIAEKRPLCGAAASRGTQGEANALCTTNRRGACYLTAGDGNLVVWTVDRFARSVHQVDVNMSKLKRVILSMDLNERDEVCYCGTSTGDVIKIRLNFHHDAEVLQPIKKPIMIGCYTKISRKKLPRGSVELYRRGVRSLKLMADQKLLIGAGDGTLDLVEEKVENKTKGSELDTVAFKLPSIPILKVIRSTNVRASITSIQLMGPNTILVGTANSEIYMMDLKTFEAELLITCHTSTVYDVAFPYKFSEVFATASKDDVRVWNTETLQELLRIKVPNFSCSSVLFSHDGKSILTAWNDGIIRAFTPLTGRLIYAIMNAHNKGVSALAITHHGRILISGGCEGQVRLWEISPYRQQLLCTLKEHNGPISAINVNEFDDEAVSASTDGSCIIWDVIRQCRKHLFFANTLFMCVKYFPSGVQILTGGTDRKVAYWEVYDGSMVREIEGSPSDAVNTLDISPDGILFVTGGNDQIVKLWKYQEGISTHIGVGHSAVVTATRFSPDGKHIISTSASGSIFVWKCPYELSEKSVEASEHSEASLEVEVNIVAPEEQKEENIQNIISTPKSGGDSAACKCRCKK